MVIAEKLVEATGTYEAKLQEKSEDGGSEAGGADGGDSEAVKQPPSSGSAELASVQCRLETKELWDKFHELGTEMIITKSGRLVTSSITVIPLDLQTGKIVTMEHEQDNRKVDQVKESRLMFHLVWKCNKQQKVHQHAAGVSVLFFMTIKIDQTSSSD